MSDLVPHQRLVPSPDEHGTTATLDLIGRARRHLAEARTLPDIRRVMEVASVAADAAQRAARLAEAQHAAVEVVEAANSAANDAAAVRIEAQAKAGELLVQMRDAGQRQPPGKRSRAATFSQLNDLGVTKSESSRWQQVARVAPEVRHEYTQAARTGKGEVSTAGLLRYARFGIDLERREAPLPAARREIDHAAIAADARRQIRAVYRGVIGLPGYRPEALVMALDPPERRQLLQALRQLSGWIDDVRRELAIHHIGEKE